MIAEEYDLDWDEIDPDEDEGGGFCKICGSSLNEFGGCRIDEAISLQLAIGQTRPRMRAIAASPQLRPSTGNPPLMVAGPTRNFAATLS